jgi:alkanesulfonate monooxygenase SsuD/methylene tetrahydromethanopterin reductase-like flavin-dependent oxidoreductase (luciferase family)
LFRVQGLYGTPEGARGPILVGALGPLMLRVAGELSDGTLATWSNEGAIESVIGPAVREAAKDAGRPEPRVGAVVPVTLTHDVTGARERVREHFAIYDSLPRYKRMVELGGATSAAEICIVGDEAELRRRLRAYSDAGLTDLLAAPFAAGDDRAASWTRTAECLAAIAGTR